MATKHKSKSKDKSKVKSKDEKDKKKAKASKPASKSSSKKPSKDKKADKGSKSKDKSSKKSAKAKKEDSGLKPLKKAYNRSELLEKLAEKTEVEKKDVKKVIETLERIILASIMPGGRGEFVMHGMFKIVTVPVKAKKMPEIKKGTEVRNPATGEMMKSKGRKAFTKPATVKVKLRSMGKLTKTAKGEA